MIILALFILIVIGIIYENYEKYSTRKSEEEYDNEILNIYNNSKFKKFNINEKLKEIIEIRKKIDPKGIGLDILLIQRERKQEARRLYDTDTRKRCKWCRSKMIIRVNSKNGNKFLGCSKYPYCKFTMGYKE